MRRRDGLLLAEYDAQATIWLSAFELFGIYAHVATIRPDICLSLDGGGHHFLCTKSDLYQRSRARMMMMAYKHICEGNNAKTAIVKPTTTRAICANTKVYITWSETMRPHTAAAPSTSQNGIRKRNTKQLFFTAPARKKDIILYLVFIIFSPHNWCTKNFFFFSKL